MKAFILSSCFASAALAGVIPRATNTTEISEAVELWQPALNSPFQIILNAIVDINKPLQPSNSFIFDVDLWDTPKETITQMKAQGKKVICYFSAGSSEDWRDDYKDFTDSDKGNCMTGWAGERWLDVRSPTVFNVMKKRIKMAKDKGCDAIDPDNMDAYDNKENGKNLQPEDAVTYLRNLALEAKSLGMSTGLKNAQSIIPQVTEFIQFAVNEECGQRKECDSYDALKAGIPVFNIEYVKPKFNGRGDLASMSWVSDEGNAKSGGGSMEQIRNNFCRDTTKAHRLSTVIKNKELDGFVLYCGKDFKYETTATTAGPTRATKECPVSGKGRNIFGKTRIW
jgi:hypothetical protein